MTARTPAAAAAREVEEETGWRPHRVEHVLSCQPIIGNADYPQELNLARGAVQAGAPHADETAEVRWVPLDEAQAMIASGDVLGAVTVIGVQHALLLRAGVQLPRRVKPRTAGTSARGTQPRNRSRR
jgi:8-oxo-dGTP pyrophosphatase MutT (NUDIX family)